MQIKTIKFNAVVEDKEYENWFEDFDLDYHYLHIFGHLN